MDRDNNTVASESPELTALTAVVMALRPLDPETRLRVADSALLLLGSQPRKTELLPPGSDKLISQGMPAGRGGASQPQGAGLDIRQLKDQKSPRSANEMAALVAYYLAEVVPPDDRKSTVDIADIEKYFKQAHFRLPRNLSMTLVNAKHAGYFDAAGGGQYKLNPVGYNLVTHSLPRSAATERFRPAGRRQASSRSKRRASGSRAPAKRR